jgi:hypothetical protein
MRTFSSDGNLLSRTKKLEHVFAFQIKRFRESSKSQNSGFSQDATLTDDLMPLKNQIPEPNPVSAKTSNSSGDAHPELTPRGGCSGYSEPS